MSQVIFVDFEVYKTHINNENREDLLKRTFDHIVHTMKNKLRNFVQLYYIILCLYLYSVLPTLVTTQHELTTTQMN